MKDLHGFVANLFKCQVVLQRIKANKMALADPGGVHL